MENTFGRNIIPQNEQQRLENLKKYNILYTESESAFDELAAYTAAVFDMPIAMINFVDKDNVWTKAIQEGEHHYKVERGSSLCALAILKDEVTVFENALKERCLLANPYVAAENGLRFYAAAPIGTTEGYNIGVICIIDRQPREFGLEDQAVLESIARMVELEIEKRIHG
ncbi:GAF domain-containing protein [Pedobacter westerhofensis]|uniref:GAF domain-containing protein n=1 Tax=Pedobacter westerhofensis TaxID=425512 RepID=A0A521C1S9_9SPHI|nr:GAF domain-containing protein [Pedobacter westerhofensis]SMO52680.1 GAF domain-containing protein [Pedobacter westerhofensis]